MFRSLSVRPFPLNRQRLSLLVSVGVGLVLGAAAMFAVYRFAAASSRAERPVAEDQDLRERGAGGAEPGGAGESAAADGAADAPAGDPQPIVLPKRKWDSAGLRVQPVQASPFQQVVWLTGKLTVNEDRLAHLHPLVEGRVDEVGARFGQRVEQGDLLAVIHSREVGDAKLALHRARLDQQVAEVNADWAKTINENTQELIAAIEGGASLAEIEQNFEDRPMGDYRDQLLSAYANLHKSEADFERLQGLSNEGITAGKELITARAAYEADQAKLASLLEKIQFSARRDSLREQQQLEKARSAVATSEAQLLILGYSSEELADLDPRAEGEQISHYEIRAPFAGTILSKDLVYGERVGPESRLFELADLSTLWVRADLYQKHLPLLESLDQETLVFRHGQQQHEHTAEIFYHGDMVDPETRTARLMAVVNNTDQQLKPGMFVEVGLPGAAQSSVIELPRTAVVDQGGETFVFVQPEAGRERFRRQRVAVEPAGDGTVQVLSGLSVGDRVVVGGLFALKTVAAGGIPEGD